MPKGKRRGKRCPYGPRYYESQCGPIPYDRSHPHWLAFFGNIAEQIVRSFRPRRVLDVGCGKGFLVECLRDGGVEAYGFDISEYAIGEARPDIQPYCWVAQSPIRPPSTLPDLSCSWSGRSPRWANSASRTRCRAERRRWAKTSLGRARGRWSSPTAKSSRPSRFR